MANERQKYNKDLNQYPHACARMLLALEAPEIPITFNAKFREFGIRVLDGGGSKLELSFCPFCGQKLPESLRAVWFDKLERMGIDPTGTDMPREFLDERWYNKPQG